MVVRVGVIGTGAMGAAHVRTLVDGVPGAAVRAVFDVVGERAAATVAGIPGVRVADDRLELIKDPDIDALIVASSDDTHEDYVLACLAAGKPVLCEKPLAPTAKGAYRLVEAELAAGRRLVTVGFMRRYDPGYGDLRRVAGELGAPLIMHCVHRNVSMPDGFSSEMLVTSSAVHEIDVTRWMLGEEIVEVAAHPPRRSELVPHGVQDPQFLVLRTASGMLVDIEVFVNARSGYDVRCEVVCERGSATLPDPAAAVVRGDGAQTAALPADFRTRFADAYRIELRDWVDGVAVGQARGASAWDGYAALAVAEACVAAMATGQREPVRLPAKSAFYM